MGLINVLDDEGLKGFISSFTNEDKALASLMEGLLLKPLKREEGQEWGKYYDPIPFYPSHAPLWLTPDKFKQNRFYKFSDEKAGQAIGRDMYHIADWLKAALFNNENWLQDLDNKHRPKRFQYLATLEQIKQAADKDMAQQANILRSRFNGQSTSVAAEQAAGDIKIAYDYGDGFYMVKLLTPAALDKESAQLGHCIGNGGYDESLKDGRKTFYSLRDHNNKAHATLEVAGNVLEQCKGKENTAPISKYMPYLQDFIKQHQWQLNESPQNTGLIEQDGEYYDLHNLPTNFIYDGDLNLNFCTNLQALSEGLQVGRNLNLNGCTNLQTLPEGLQVGRNLNLNGCTNLQTLPEGLQVGRNLNLNGCTNLQTLPEGLQVGGGWLNLEGCTNLKTLPRDMAVKYKIYWDDREFLSVAEFRKAFEEKQQQQPTPQPAPAL